MMGITVWCPLYGKTAQLGSVGQLWKTHMSLLLHAMFGAALDAQENRLDATRFAWFGPCFGKENNLHSTGFVLQVMERILSRWTTNKAKK
jgi:hypothetical protein